MADPTGQERRTRTTRPARPRRVHLASTVVVVTVVLSVSGAGAAAVPVSAARVPAVSAAQQPDDVPQLPEPQASAADARQRADQILAGDEYKEAEPNWFERALQWVGDRINDVLRRLFGDRPGQPGGAGGGSTLAWVVIALLVGVVIFLVARARGRRKPREDDGLDDPVFVSEVESRRTADEWLDQADRHESAGEWKAALRCRYRALIVELIEHGVVRDLPGRTSGEFRLEVRRRAPTLDDAFSTASGLFDAAFYGDLPTGPAESVQFQSAATQILDGMAAVRGSVGAASSSGGFVAPGADA